MKIGKKMVAGVIGGFALIGVIAAFSGNDSSTNTQPVNKSSSESVGQVQGETVEQAVETAPSVEPVQPETTPSTSPVVEQAATPKQTVPKPVPTPPPAPQLAPTPTLVSAPAPKPEPEPYTPPTSSQFNCSVKKTCPQMRSCEEAYFYLNTCGDRQRDGDKDGVPCEDICPGG